ncbi:MAG: GSCFA domain-containing protein [Emticicia sp.]|nr:GSCFA domain-containing protein [Emticicia sp.]
MEFRTEIEVAPARFNISTDSKIMTVGSCFSEVIGSQLTDNKLQCLCNPYGTVFNPSSIFKLISHSLQNQPVFKHLMLENNGIWQHYDFHSKFYANSKEELEQELNLTHKKVNQFLRKANFLVITLGTSIVHQLKENSQIVSNCHKTPASNFRKEMLTVKEILLRFRPMYEALKMQNNKIKILLTVSPVRHTRETLQLNSVSKSILRTVCYHLEQDFNDVHYFPSYEIMMDDLRDYRFYKADMIHPNEQAEQYIFEKFAQTYFTEDLNSFLKEWNKVRMSLNHRPIQTDTVAHQKFLTDLLVKLDGFSNKFDVSNEIEIVRSQLIAA